MISRERIGKIENSLICLAVVWAFVGTLAVVIGLAGVVRELIR